MWTRVNNKLKLDISKVSSNFKITQSDNLFLIHPHKSVWSYTEDEKKLRSIIVDEKGFIISSAWPKFGNWGEFPNDTKILEDALKYGVVRFSHKEDGSLCIRSVINNKVILRTRGTLFGGASEDEQTFGEKFEIVAKKYPKIFDANWMTDRSLLFEYVAPSNVVVVRYKEEDLIFLGFVKHDTLEIGRWEEIASIAKEANFNLVRLHNLPRDPIQLKEEIKYWKDEGVVVRCCDDQVFVKVKSAYYLANHRMKYSITYEMINELLDSLGIVGGGQEERFKDELRKCEYDWEIVESALEFYNRYVKSYNYVQGILSEAKRLFEEWRFKTDVILWNSESDKRKEFARFACSQRKPISSFLFNLYDDCYHNKGQFEIEKLTKKLILKEETK